MPACVRKRESEWERKKEEKNSEKKEKAEREDSIMWYPLWYVRWGRRQTAWAVCSLTHPVVCGPAEQWGDVSVCVNSKQKWSREAQHSPVNKKWRHTSRIVFCVRHKEDWDESIPRGNVQTWMSKNFYCFVASVFSSIIHLILCAFYINAQNVTFSEWLSEWERSSRDKYFPDFSSSAIMRMIFKVLSEMTLCLSKERALN